MSINRVCVNDKNEPILSEDESVLFKEAAVVQFDVERHAKYSGSKRVKLVITSKQVPAWSDLSAWGIHVFGNFI
ncbi:hypothetical protein AAVH_09750 [Aphelenchoides avenae]|nr:hypothetical protein AAVH_09750 [Aphelenchus avenae]